MPQNAYLVHKVALSEASGVLEDLPHSPAFDQLVQDYAVDESVSIDVLNIDAGNWHFPQEVKGFHDSTTYTAPDPFAPFKIYRFVATLEVIPAKTDSSEVPHESAAHM